MNSHKLEYLNSISRSIENTKLGIFSAQVYFLLVENFPQTYFVGGIVRNVILKKKISDVDIATSATPEKIIGLLKTHGVETSDTNKNFGSIVARRGSHTVEITTFRKDYHTKSRYPKVEFIKSSKVDSKRRDFTINALYLSPKTGKIFDYNGGIADVKKRLIRFIGHPKKRIEEDPLRIVRALRFALILKFKLELKTKAAIKNNLYLTKNLSKNKLEKEINKIQNRNQKNILKKVINSPNLLDKYFK